MEISRRKIKVLFIIPSLGKGGAERLVLDVCRQFNSVETIEYKLVILNRKNEYKSEYSDVLTHFVNCNVELSFFLKDKYDVSELMSIIDSFRPNIVHSHIYYADLVSRLILRDDIKYVSHIHGKTTQYEKFPIKGLFNKTSFTNEYEKRLVFNKYNQVENYFITVSSFYRNYLLQHTNIKPDRILVLPNAIDLNKFHSRSSERSNSDILNLITIGRLEKHKGHSFLIDVVKELVDKGVNLHLNILGDGSLFNDLQNQISKMHLDKFITLRGNVNNPEEFLLNSDIYIHGAFDESFGLVLIEAMASGLPVITTNAGGSNELIIESENGFIIKDRDVIKFSNTIIQLKSDPVKLKLMSKNAINFSKKFDIIDYCNNLINFYNKILKC